MSNNQGMFSNLSTFYTFIAGAVAGILVICTVGFFILAGIYFKGDSSSVVVAGDDNPTEVKPVDEGIKISPTISADRDHIRGNADAELTFIEFSDIECPFCKRFHETTEQLFAKYSNDVRFVFRHFPIDSLHQNARTEALATECAAEQGKFWEMLDLIFTKTNSNDGLDLNALPDLASQLGLNVGQFNGCMESEKFKSKVSEDEQSAVAAGARGTPYSVILTADGRTKVVSGAQPLATIEAAIKEMQN